MPDDIELGEADDTNTNNNDAIDQRPNTINLPTANFGNEKLSIGQLEKVYECLKTRQITDREVQRLLSRLVPFSKSAPGTNAYFKNEQKKLQSILGSPLYQTNPWSWFVTMSNADIFEEYIYRILHSDSNGIASPGYEDLNRSQRAKLLRDHPAVAVRTFMMKQMLLLDYIMNSKSKPLGEVDDYWIRVEFQRSWNAHLHYLLSVRGRPGLGCLIDAENV